MKILNKNSTGSRNRALTEREVMQELTLGDKNYGKIVVGTDGTYEGEVLIGKDSDVQNALANIDATHPFNGYAGSKKDMRFETSTNNILKVTNMQEQYIVDGKVVKPTGTIDLNTTNDRTGFNGEGDNSFVPHVHVVGFDPISTGTITGNKVATDAQIGTILDNIPAQTANTRIKCRVKPTTDGIKVEILDKSDSDAVVRTQTVNSTDTETLTFTLPVNDDGYKVKATKITNDGVDSDDTDERIDVTSEVSTGLVVDGKVKRGDYCVVDKEELANAEEGNAGDGWSVSDNSKVSSNGDNTKISYFTDLTKPLISGLKYKLFFELQNYSGSDTMGFDDEQGVSSNARFDSDATYSEVFISNGRALAVFNRDSNSGTISFSVQLADDTFKAIEDTDDGESLASSKFKPADYISNQVFVGMKDDGTYTYDVLMNDAYTKESTTETLTNNGYSSLGKGLFSKGSDVITPIGRWQTLNSGAYHPILNFAGTRGFWTKVGSQYDNSYGDWYGNRGDIAKVSISDLFNFVDGSIYIKGISHVSNYNNFGSIISTVSGHPQGKFYNIVYPSQWLDMRYSSTKTNLHDTASKVFSDGVSGKGGVCDTVGMVAAIETLGSSTQARIGLQKKNFTTFPTYLYGTTGYHEGQAFVFKGFNAEDAGNWYLTIDRTIDLVIEKDVFFTKDLPITQVGEQLTTDLIGSPENYPQILKDRLTSGDTVIGINPLLVNQDGTSPIPNPDSNVQIILSKRTLTNPTLIISENSGKTYSANSTIIRTTNNYVVGATTNQKIHFTSYTASIPVATIQDPKIVDYVLEKYIAQNDASIYKGANITALIGIPTGDGDGTMESGYLGDCDVGTYDEVVEAGILNTYGTNYPDKTFLDTHNGLIYEYTGSTTSNTLDLYTAGSLSSSPSSWKHIGFTSQIPSHSTISLSSTGDKASKAFLTIASDNNNELYAQWMIEELASGWDGTSTFKDDTTTGLTIGKVYQEQTSKLLYRALADKITVSDTATWSNPFDGDSGEFEQLTNSVVTDVNGNVCRTVVASTPLNLLKDV